MREYLFRGKTTKKTGTKEFNSGWVEGDLIISADKYYIHPRNNKIRVEGELGKLIVMHEVVPETVGKYIGRKDKNGKKIFEGDLLNGFDYPFYRSEDSVHNYFAEIAWFDENCAFGLVTHKHPTSKVQGISEGNTDYIEEFDLSEWEVFGNIYDNPELLESRE